MTAAESRKNLHAALGAVVEEAAGLEVSLRITFCALVGSKYAVIICAGENTGWLIGRCEALAKAHREITDDSRDRLLVALRRCREANSSRNRLLHDAWAVLPSGELGQIQSKRLSPRLNTRSITYEEIIAIYCELADAVAQLRLVRDDVLDSDQTYNFSFGLELDEINVEIEELRRQG